MVGDGPLMEIYAALAAALRIRRGMDAGRHVEHARAHSRDELFVLPSLNEGISNTILEAMASGLPVIATAVGGMWN